MKRFFASVLVALSLSACSSQQLPLVRSANPLQAQSASQPRLFEKFKGYVNHSQYDQSGLAEMLMTATSLLGKVYDNKNSASRYHLYYQGQNSSLSEAIGPIRLGKDNVLYLEDIVINSGAPTSRQYYRLGSFQPGGLANGQEVAFQLDKGNSLKMKWRGINPMDHDELHLTISPAIKPVPKDPASFY